MIIVIGLNILNFSKIAKKVINTHLKSSVTLEYKWDVCQKTRDSENGRGNEWM